MARASEKGAPQPAPLKISRTLHARRQTVFAAWTSAESVKHWFCPETYSIPAATVEARQGGTFDVCMRAPSGEEHWSRGKIVELVPDERLVIDFRVAGPDGRDLFRAYTEVAFSDVLGGTKLDIVQTYTFADPAIAAPMVKGASQGWAQTLDKLEKVVMRLQGGVDTGVRNVVHGQFHLERTYEAPAARVWKALTELEAKAKWFAGGWELLERSMDVRVGGREHLRGRWQGGVVSDFDALYHDVVPNERLVYSYVMHLNDKKISVSLATVELRAQGSKTTLAVTEQGAFLDGYDDAGAREHGTAQLLDALGKSLQN